VPPFAHQGEIMNFQKAFVAASIIVVSSVAWFCTAIIHEAQSKTWTTENCVMEKWEQWESIRGEMPTKENEKMFRDECWSELRTAAN
jgi:hypothetical protein